ncbi:MAG: hypothetical protein RLZZ385_554 [Pseudomonadota bacterium]|jgi:uncharacterized protein YndB with AHSA1/START domain
MGDADKAVKIRLQRSFAATPEQVFDAWVIPTLLGNWMFGPKVRREEIISLENTPRVGGMFSYVVQRDGHTINHIGRFLEIRRPEKLQFTWGIEGEGGDNSTVLLSLLQEQGKTRLQLVHELPGDYAHYAEQVKQSWAHMCDALTTLLNKKSSQQSLLR